MRPALIQVTRVGRHSERVFQDAISLIEQLGSADALRLRFFRNALVSSAWRHCISRRRVGVCRVHKQRRCTLLGSIDAISVQSRDMLRSFKTRMSLAISIAPRDVTIPHPGIRGNWTDREETFFLRLLSCLLIQAWGHQRLVWCYVQKCKWPPETRLIFVLTTKCKPPMYCNLLPGPPYLAIWFLHQTSLARSS